jgi:hypothetical protein
MPSIDRARPDAPTRPAEAKKADRFRTLVYHVEESDLFITVDYDAKPAPGDWIVVRRQDSNITIALYRGQGWLGVVRVLEFYQLQQSEQWAPRIYSLMLQFTGLTAALANLLMTA